MQALNAPTSEALEPEERAELMAARDSSDLEWVFARLLRRRQQALTLGMGRLARELHDAVRSLTAEVKLDAVEHGNVDAARAHLQAAMRISADAADANLDIGERLLALVRDIEAQARVLQARDGTSDTSLLADSLAFASSVEGVSGQLRDGLGDLMVAQSWADLSGQRMRRVMAFMDHVDHVLVNLVALVGAAASGAPAESAESPAPMRATGQDQVDQLLAELGF